MTAHANLESPSSPTVPPAPTAPFWEFAFEALAQGVTVQDAQGRFVFANQAAAELLGCPSRKVLLETPPELLLRRFELFDVENRPLAPHQLPSRRALQERVAAEERVVFRERATGKQRIAVLHSEPVLERGALSYVVNTFRDITDQERVESGLRFLAEASRILSGSLDTDKTLDAVARLAVPKLADWCAIELVDEGHEVGRQVAVAHVDPTKVKFARELRERYPPRPDSPHGLPNVIRTGKPEIYEEIPDELLVQGAIDAEHLRISRELGLTSAVIVPLCARGRVLGALTLVHAESNRRFSKADLEILMELAGRAAVAVDNALLFEGARQLSQVRIERELAQAGQERIARVLESITDPFLALDAEWRVSFLNTAAAASYRTTRAQLVGKRLEELDDSEQTRQLLQHCQRARTENRPRQFEHYSPRQNAWFDMHAYPFEGGVSLYARDVTARRHAEDALARHTEELSRSNAELERFAYVASHDLQEPLRMVASYTQLLGRRYKGKLDADADEFIHYAVDGVTRMQQLINDLLAYSRVGTRGKEFGTVPVGKVLDRALQNLQFALEESGAQVTRGELPTVSADDGQLSQLFQNLIGNAIKFRGAEAPRIDVSATPEDGGWHFRVKDNGIGIDPQYFQRIFIIFQRLHGSTEYPGTGIGLAICKKIVERHGGRIWVESAPDQGSVFHFVLPQRPPPPAGGRLL